MNQIRWVVVLMALSGLGQENCPDDETCDGRDNDYDGQIDEDFDADEDGFPGAEVCADLATFDCDDADAAVSPGAAEILGDAVDNNCDGASEVTAWVTLGPSPEPGVPAFDTIAAALAAGEGAAVVAVSPGLWRESLTVDGGQAFVFATEGRDTTTIDAGGRGATLTVRGSASVEVRGFTLTGGASELGGCVAVNASTVALRDSSLTGCLAFDRGGAVWADGGATVEITGSDLRQNEAFEGGGMYIGAASLTTRDVTLSDNQAYSLISSAIVPASSGGISWNELHTGYGGSGGGLALGAGAEAVLETTAITQNISMSGGGVHHEGLMLILVNSTVSGNTAWMPDTIRDASAAPSPMVETEYAGSGGGLYLAGDTQLMDTQVSQNQSLSGGGLCVRGAELVVDGVTMEGNVGHGILRRVEEGGGTLDIYAGEGGGMSLGPSAALVGSRLQITGGRAIYGGGIYAVESTLKLAGVVLAGTLADAVSVDDGRSGLRSYLGTGGGAYLSASQVDWEAVLVENAHARVLGGGLLVVGSQGENRLVNATVVGAGAATGGGVRFDSIGGSWELKNLIVAFSAAGGGIYGPLPIGSLSYSNVFGNAGGDFLGGADGEGGDGMISADPAFVRYVPGSEPPEGDLHLSDSSPSQDTGDPDPAYADVDGSRNDMGAYGGPSGGLITARAR